MEEFFTQFWNLTLTFINRWLIPDVLNDVPGKLGLEFDATQITFSIYGFMLVMMMILRPQGLLPERRHKLELSEDVETTELAVSSRFTGFRVTG